MHLSWINITLWNIVHILVILINRHLSISTLWKSTNLRKLSLILNWHLLLLECRIIWMVGLLMHKLSVLRSKVLLNLRLLHIDRHTIRHILIVYKRSYSIHSLWYLTSTEVLIHLILNHLWLEVSLSIQLVLLI